MYNTTIKEVLDRLDGVRKNGAGWLARCPAHDDRTPSLSVTEGDGGKLLLRCFASCSFEEVMDALGLKQEQRPPTVFAVKNVKGETIAFHHRIDTPEGKRVWWTRPDGKKGLNGIPTSALPLFGSEIIPALDDKEFVVVVEGEKAADALNSKGIPALGTVTGAAGTPGPEPLSVLEGRTVVLWPDADEEGRDHMRRIAVRLDKIASEVRIFEWAEAPAKGDAADYRLNGCESVQKLMEALANAPVCSSTTDAQPVGILLSQVEPERVRWLWSRRIPYGKLTLVDGDPGAGKSALTTDLAVRVSAGRNMPDGSPCDPGGVVLLNAEDGPADTIRPRLEAAGADLDRVLALATMPDGDGERLISIPEDLGIIRRGIEQVGAKLVVVDPLMAFISGDVNSHRDQDIRRALAPLAKLAEDTGAAVVVVRHLNKTPGGNALYRGGGSIGIIGQARSALLVARHPEDDRRRVLAPLKCNLAAPPPSLAFVLTDAANGAVRVEWKGETPLNADALLAAPVDDEQRVQATALRTAIEGLLDDHDDQWEGTPTELHNALAEINLAAVPDRAAELTKLLLKVARAATTFTAQRGHRGNERVLRLHRQHDPEPSDAVGTVGTVGDDTQPTDTTDGTDGNTRSWNGVGGDVLLGGR